MVVPVQLENELLGFAGERSACSGGMLGKVALLQVEVPDQAMEFATAILLEEQSSLRWFKIGQFITKMSVLRQLWYKLYSNRKNHVCNFVSL